MIDFKAPVDDILFALTYGAKAERLSEWDEDLAKEVLTQAGKFFEGEIAPMDPEVDRLGARLENGRVRVPDCMVDSYAKFREAGWPGIIMPERFGGQELPQVLGTAVSEMLSGSCVMFQMLLSLGQGAMKTIASHGTEEQKKRYLPKMVSGEHLATMCLTEPEAGSDLGRIRAMATPNEDGSWSISGSKIFISGGDQNMTSNIVHLVLARTPDAPPGVKGLALFICPAVLQDGTRNNLAAVRLEEKMGMHASPTCQMAFDDAKAEILGKPGEGLMRMFTMMNATRLDVAAQGVGLAEVATQRARNHAQERVQGKGLIAGHGDVQRMMLHQLALTLGGRAMVYKTDIDLELDPKSPLASFMTPICKAFCTDAANDVSNLAVQIHGGYGYCREYRVEQVVRDSRITAIYEGTNGIQAMTLCGRMLSIGDGICAKAFEEDVKGLVSAHTLIDWRRASKAIQGLNDPGLLAHSYLRLCSLVALGATWRRLEEAADQAPNPGKIKAVAAYVRSFLLPETALLADRIESGIEIAGDEIFG